MRNACLLALCACMLFVGGCGDESNPANPNNPTDPVVTPDPSNPVVTPDPIVPDPGTVTSGKITGTWVITSGAGTTISPALSSYEFAEIFTFTDTSISCYNMECNTNDSYTCQVIDISYDGNKIVTSGTSDIFGDTCTFVSTAAELTITSYGFQIIMIPYTGTVPPAIWVTKNPVVLPVVEKPVTVDEVVGRWACIEIKDVLGSEKFNPSENAYANAYIMEITQNQITRHNWNLWVSGIEVDRADIRFEGNEGKTIYSSSTENLLYTCKKVGDTLIVKSMCANCNTEYFIPYTEESLPQSWSDEPDTGGVDDPVVEDPVVDNPDSEEPNNTASEAKLVINLAVDMSKEVELSLTSGDTDWVKVELPVDAELKLTYDIVDKCEVYDSPTAVTPLEPINTTSLNVTSTFSVNAGTYYVKFFSTTGEVGNYSIYATYKSMADIIAEREKKINDAISVLRVLETSSPDYLNQILSDGGFSSIDEYEEHLRNGGDFIQ